MHFWQALKMASKSLWTNKLRSFLTMLGIIIGVVTVSLLTSVAQGVSSIIVSSIKTQSTLAVFMNMNSRLTMSEADSIFKDCQPEDENADDYFEYSLIYSTTSIVANEALRNIESGGIANYLTPKRTYTMSDFLNYDEMTDEEKGIVQLLIQSPKHNYVYGASVYAVDSNFTNVYELELEGRYCENEDEIVVDTDFIKTYLGENYSNTDAINQEVTLGVQMYTELIFTFDSQSSADLGIELIVEYLSQDNTELEISVDVIANSDGSLYVYDESTLTLTLNIELFSYLSNEELYDLIAPNLDSYNVGLEVNDVYDISNAKTYKIVGILSEDSSSLMSSLTTSSSSSDSDSSSSVLLTYISSLSSSMGTCYMLYSDDNAKTFGETNVSSSTISYAYLRYNNEDSMSSSTTNIVVAFANKGYSYMSDFMMVSFSSVASILSSVMNVLTIMLTVISIISLIVGGIGIMNIMLVAVTERTREIGIRKAIGAKKSSILVQFLVEALMLSILGGLIGLGISAIAIAIISNVMGVTLTIPLWVIGMSVGFCTAIGLIFGMFPAVKASNMQPIDALRRD